MKIIRRIIAFFTAPLMAATLMTAHAADPVIEQAKAQGIVGEQFDGYLGFADPSKASADLKRRVSENNAKRLELYTQTAQQTRTKVSDVAAVTAEKQIAGASSGEMVLPGPGASWTRK
jgi:hypothetical protein